MQRTALDRRALGLALTRIANGGATGSMFGHCAPVAAPARRIGLTGAPGSGKSSLAGRLAIQRQRVRGNTARVGVLAIDPSSPKTGGAILGDRIRMDDLPGAENLFIRSFGSRTASDGLTDHLPELLDAMDSFGFDEVLVETVGVGQAEYAVRTQVDTLVLVVPPDAGDVVQAMKAGIMEMADIVAVNKADMPSAMKMANDIRRIISLSPTVMNGWPVPVVMTSSSRPESITDLSAQLDLHASWLQTSGEAAARMITRRKYALRRHLERAVQRTIGALPDDFFQQPMATQLTGLIDLLKLGEVAAQK